MELSQLTKRAEPIALEALDHPQDFMPRTFAAPDIALAGPLSEALGYLHVGDGQGARKVLLRVCVDPLMRQHLGDYREHVTWTEADNARRLRALAWVHTILLPRALEGDDLLLDKLRTLETLAETEYGVREIHDKRAWAEAVTRRYDLLPRTWREAE